MQILLIVKMTLMEKAPWFRLFFQACILTHVLFLLKSSFVQIILIKGDSGNSIVVKSHAYQVVSRIRFTFVNKFSI